MDCAPFKKPSRKAGLFSYRSVIPPSPHETLLAQTFAGAPAARWAAMRGGASLAAVFLQKSPRAHSAAAPSPHETLLAQTFAGAPAARWAAIRGRRTACDELFCFTKSSSRAHSAAPRFPTKLCLRKFPRGPRPPGGRPSGDYVSLATSFFVSQKAHRALTLLLLVSPRNFASQISAGAPPPCGRPCEGGVSLAAAFDFVPCPFLDKERGICYAVSQIIRKGSVTRKAMDDGDSNGGENPPLPHICSFIGHSLCLRE